MSRSTNFGPRVLEPAWKPVWHWHRAFPPDAMAESAARRLANPLTWIFDPITASAPFERVNLVAVRRPRLGGKEPSNVDYRMRFSPALSADRDDGCRDR